MNKLLAICCCIILIATACKRDNFSYQEQLRQLLAFDMLQQDTSLSISVQALEKTKMSATLNTYGPFTFFIPDNNAWRKFFSGKVKTKLDDFSEEELKTILVYHILPTRIKSAEFIQGPQTTPTGRGDFITLDISKGFKVNTIANGIAKVYATDIEYSNALVHKIDAVLNPPTLTIGEFLEQNKSVYSIMIGGLKRTGLMDTLTRLTDWRGQRIRVTLFAETDDVLKAAGIQDLNSMPIEEVEALMRYHIIPGANFSASYSQLRPAFRPLNVIEHWDSTLLCINNNDYIYVNLAGSKLINETADFSATDVIMRNGVIHNVEKHIAFNPALKRTQIYHVFWKNAAYCYGIPGFTSAQLATLNASGGRWRYYPETFLGRTENFLFMDPDNINDSLVAIVKNVRRGKYRIEVSYKNGFNRGDYQLKHGDDLIGNVINFTQGSQYEQKLVIGTYDFKTSGDKRLNFVCTRQGGINLEALVLTPEY
ncbi:fasciclin domain-containing protein [Niastella sp. OAS944]|uniref:fasciclin domain-containing protein n=1 Tax=Niastella sp. OAS944 TaxID=2664089 RepID=UPI00348E81ED|nr:putative surface protein with fasciclin (FAS1) repeats [Chitinophagaceae bacterium OAS944]